jgi:hypothetical protein
MKHAIASVIVSIVLFAAAYFAWRESGSLEARADSHERYATLRFANLDSPTAEYWRGQYDRVAGATDTTADTSAERLLLAANASFRASQQNVQSRQAQIQQLDVVLQQYATALKAPAYLPDAAYNYEYVARLRDSLSKPRAATLPAPDMTTAGDLPGGPTIHGRPGGPPPSSKGEEFQIITPQEFGDRETQPEPNPGGKPLRKG